MANGKILIVDDDASILHLATQVLRREGYEVTDAASAQDALLALTQERFDLVLADIVMPEMSGLELIQRARETNPNLAAMVITGYGTIEMAVKSLKAGVLDFVVKPFTIDELRTAVEEALEHSRLAAENVRLRRLIHLFEVARTFIASSTLDDLFPRVARTVAEEVEADAASLLIVDFQQQQLLTAAVYNLPEHLVGKVRGAINEGPLGRVVARAEPLLWAANRDGSLSLSQSEDVLVGSLLAIPLVVDNLVIGVLEMTRMIGGKPFTIDDLEAASLLTSHAAVALYNAEQQTQLRTSIDQSILDAFHRLLRQGGKSASD
ncbi:MAG: response regulator [Chloroflexi bacterium]|nr:response regulator [Chloroflexota bacterium]